MNLGKSESWRKSNNKDRFLIESKLSQIRVLGKQKRPQIFPWIQLTVGIHIERLVQIAGPQNPSSNFWNFQAKEKVSRITQFRGILSDLWKTAPTRSTKGWKIRRCDARGEGFWSVCSLEQFTQISFQLKRKLWVSWPGWFRRSHWTLRHIELNYVDQSSSILNRNMFDVTPHTFLFRLYFI